MFDNELDQLTWDFCHRRRMSQIQVRDPDGKGIPRINIRISTGHQGSDQAIFDVFTDLAGNTGWPIPYWPLVDYTLWVNDQNVNPAYGQISLFITNSGDQLITLPKTGIVPAGPLARLTSISSHRMVNERGEKIAGRGASAFLLYKKFLDGEDIQPQLDQLKSLGCHLLRVFGMFESLGGFNPKDYPQYYDQILAFCAKCADSGFYVLWTCCAATQGIFSNDDEVITHIRRTVNRLLTTQNALCSPVNEQGQHNNSINLGRVKAEINFGWLLHDMGSYGQDLPCSPPLGTHAVLHTLRSYSHNIRDCVVLDNPNFVNDHLEVGLDEPARFGVTDDPGGNGDVQQAADAAGTAHTALFFVFHSLQGEKGEVLRDNTLDCATAAFGAMKGR